VAHPANASHERGDSASLGDLVCLSRMRKRGWHHLEKSFLLELVPMRCATCLVVGWGFGTRMPCSRSTAVASLTLPDSSMMISSSLHRSTMTIGFHQLENGASSRPLFASGASGPFPRSFPRLFAKRFPGGGTRPPAARIRDSKGPGRAQDTPGRARRAAERCHIGLERSFPFPALELVARQQTKSASAGVRRAAHTHTHTHTHREREGESLAAVGRQGHTVRHLFVGPAFVTYSSRSPSLPREKSLLQLRAPRWRCWLGEFHSPKHREHPERGGQESRRARMDLNMTWPKLRWVALALVLSGAAIFAVFKM
jgi:hypothetical protein